MVALPWAVVYLLAVLVFLIALGLELVYTHSLGALLNGIARLFFLIRLRIFGHTIISAAAVGRGVQRLDHTLRAAIGDAVAGSEHAVLKLWSAGGVIASYLGRAFVGLANDAVRTFSLLRHVTIPAMIAAALGPVELLLYKTHRYLVRFVKSELARLLHKTTAIAHELPAIRGDARRWAKAAAAAAAAAAGALTLPGSISIDWPFGATPTNIRKRIARLERLLGLSAIAGAALYALSRVAPWVRCRNWQRVGRDVCRMPSHLLSDLLALVTDFAVLTNICTVIPWLEQAFSFTAAPLITELTKAGAGLCRGNQIAKPLPPVTLYLPETTALAPLGE